MSIALMKATKAFVRGAFTRQQLVDVEYYGGEFSADEVGQSSFKTPAMLLACLGWTPTTGRERVAHHDARVVHMAAFVVTGNSDRQTRMLEAQQLAELLDLALRMWVPENGPAEPVELFAPEDGVRCENVYNKKIDAKGQALWLVSWRQCVKPTRPLPAMFDLVSVDIHNKVVVRPSPEDGDEGTPPVVTEEISFIQQPD